MGRSSSPTHIKVNLNIEADITFKIGLKLQERLRENNNFDTELEDLLKMIVQCHYRLGQIDGFADLSDDELIITNEDWTVWGVFKK
jgi:hypothetical protein